MKKYIIGAILILSLSILLFSNNKDDIAVKKPVQNLITTTVEDEYLWGLHSFHEDRIEAVPDIDLITAGQISCSFLDEGYTIPNVVIYLVSSEESVNGDYILANEIVANAVFTYCKEFIPQLNAINP